jgi:potassium/chloride transporter 9
MVFVEYESEVEEETARVQALLEKLRIEAEVKVFWLASGHLKTYEHIINGNTDDIDAQIIVSEALRDEGWWDELQTFRGQMGEMSASQEMSQIAHILDSTSGRPGLYNPHEETGTERRRSSVAAELAEMPKKPDITMLSKLGVSVGIHTHHLNDEVFEESSGDEITDSEGESSETDGEVMPFMAPHPPTPYPFAPGETGHQPAVPNSARRRGRSQKKASAEGSPKTATESDSLTTATPWYGTMSTSDTLRPEMATVVPLAAKRIPDISETVASPPAKAESGAIVEDERPAKFPSLGPLDIPPFVAKDADTPPRRSRSTSPSRKTGAATPVRPVVSRQASAVKFSSRPVPETTVTGEDSRISFAPQTPQNRSARETPRTERPSHSRQSSLGKFSSRPVPEAKVTAGEGGARTITFAEQPVYHPSASSSRHHSRQGSQFSYFGDAVYNIPDLKDSYKSGIKTPEGGGSIGDGGSAYSTQSVALSFNDLPSRAQHLILNELMKQHSSDTAVLLSTLPIPSEGTCADEPATVQYLSDVELLCSELPPMIMVLSNNMTVTVSL